MKDKIGFWGADQKDNDILVALLRANDNRVDLWAFPKDKHNEAFFDKMFQNWNDLNPDEFERTFYVHRTKHVATQFVARQYPHQKCRYYSPYRKRMVRAYTFDETSRAIRK